MATGAWVCGEDEAGQTLRPPKARTWSRRGRTPVVAVSGKGSGRVSVTGLVCYRSGHRSHLFYRMRIHRGHKGERKSLSEADLAALLSAAHQQLHALLIVVWANLNTHTSKAMTRSSRPPRMADRHTPAGLRTGTQPHRRCMGEHEKRLGNLAAHSVDHLAAIVRNRLKRIQCRPDLINGFLAQTGLILDAQPHDQTLAFNLCNGLYLPTSPPPDCSSPETTL